MNSNNSTTIVTPTLARKMPNSLWQPISGFETLNVIKRKQLPLEVGRAITKSAISILSRSNEPDQHSTNRTGLVVGYVQSGKTLSFTTVMALARDNDYQLIIVIPGISKSLLYQSTERLREDLYIDDIEGAPRWDIYTNPDDSVRYRDPIERALEDWHNPKVPRNERRTVIIAVMKNHLHLAKLVSLLNNMKLGDVPTLLIDDEADQASLNTQVNRGRESTTYQRLQELRRSVRGHTYLQYTATPQAPLLINIIDSLSPDFVEVLNPGKDYIGGMAFFNSAQKLVSIIPDTDVLSEENHLEKPPESLLYALRIFLLGVAAGILQGRSKNNINRSMLVHPSRETSQHLDYWRWISEIFRDWNAMISQDENDLDRANFIKDFRNAYADLDRTVSRLPSFTKISDTLPRVFSQTSIEEVNARGKNVTPIIDWKRSYGWILVGGQAMDRGFTVEGLTVTYMPRGPGVHNADTIQQRGRFFGYKRPYLGYCRTFLEQDVLTAFQEYITHEEDMRHQLQHVSKQGDSLDKWKRAFVLSPKLRPCRENVIQYKYVRGNYSDKWFAPHFVYSGEDVDRHNKIAVTAFLDKFRFHPNEGNVKRNLAQMHNVCHNIPLATIINELLLSYRLTARRDTKEVTGVLLQLSNALEISNKEKCSVYWMSPKFERKRSVDARGNILNLFQGASPVHPLEYRGTTYPGDQEIHEAKDVTVQVHFVNLQRKGKVFAKKVPVLAVWLPKRMELPWIMQEQS